MQFIDCLFYMLGLSWYGLVFCGRVVWKVFVFCCYVFLVFSGCVRLVIVVFLFCDEGVVFVKCDVQVMGGDICSGVGVV